MLRFGHTLRAVVNGQQGSAKGNPNRSWQGEQVARYVERHPEPTTWMLVGAVLAATVIGGAAAAASLALGLLLAGLLGLVVVPALIDLATLDPAWVIPEARGEHGHHRWAEVPLVGGAWAVPMGAGTVLVRRWDGDAVRLPTYRPDRLAEALSAALADRGRGAAPGG